MELVLDDDDPFTSLIQQYHNGKMQPTTEALHVPQAEDLLSSYHDALVPGPENAPSVSADANMHKNGSQLAQQMENDLWKMLEQELVE